MGLHWEIDNYRNDILFDSPVDFQSRSNKFDRDLYKASFQLSHRRLIKWSILHCFGSLAGATRRLHDRFDSTFSVALLIVSTTIPFPFLVFSFYIDSHTASIGSLPQPFFSSHPPLPLPLVKFPFSLLLGGYVVCSEALARKKPFFWSHWFHYYFHARSCLQRYIYYCPTLRTILSTATDHLMRSGMWTLDLLFAQPRSNF